MKNLMLVASIMLGILMGLGNLNYADNAKIDQETIRVQRATIVTLTAKNISMAHTITELGTINLSLLKALDKK